MCFTMHQNAFPPLTQASIRLCLYVPWGILSDRCLLPNAKWISPVWLSMPEGGAATGLPASGSGVDNGEEGSD